MHFPIALLLGGLAAELAALVRPSSRQGLRAAATWCLWLGAASAWIAVGLGEVAQSYAPHVPAAWRTLAKHSRLAYWTAGVAAVLSAWRFAAPAKGRALFLAAWAALAGLLIYTASQGGELVFTHGMGTAASRDGL